MRLALSILATVTILLSTFSIALLYGGSLSDTDPLFGVALLTTALGFLTAVVTLTLAVILAAMRRQFGWLAGVSGAAGFAIVGSIVAELLVQLLYVSPGTLPACQTAIPTAPECQQSQLQLLAVSSPEVIVMAGPLLVGLVALLYSFNVRPATAAPLAARPNGVSHL